jgi:hypothetical protein
MNFRKLAILTALLVLSLPSFAENVVVYSQTFDMTGNAYSSQNDTASLGNFATVYDNFTLGAADMIVEIQFAGEYFNPPAQGPITGWTVTFYADNAGQPGAALPGGINIAGTGDETFLGTFGGFPTYTYDIVGLNFAASAGTQYWVSVIPDLAFPPQWGWSSGTGGDGISYQDFFGVRSQLGADMAFNLVAPGVQTTPEPGTLVMLGTGVLGLAGAIRRKLF